MHLARVWLTDFRGYATAEVDLDPGLTAVVGANGEGKSNLLEAVGLARRPALVPGCAHRGPGPGGGRAGHRPGRGRPRRAGPAGGVRDRAGRPEPHAGQPPARAPGPRRPGVPAGRRVLPRRPGAGQGRAGGAAPLPRRPAGGPRPPQRGRPVRPGAHPAPAVRPAQAVRRSAEPRGGGHPRRVGRPPHHHRRGPGRRPGRAGRATWARRWPRPTATWPAGERWRLRLRAGLARGRAAGRPPRASVATSCGAASAWSAPTATSSTSPSTGSRPAPTRRRASSAAWPWPSAWPAPGWWPRPWTPPPLLLLDDVFSELDPERSAALLAHLPAGPDRHHHRHRPAPRRGGPRAGSSGWRARRGHPGRPTGALPTRG